LTGADTVVFYDSDFNPQMDRQCEDRYVFFFPFYFLIFNANPSCRAHRIGQIRDVHIYRFVSQHTVEEAMLRKANQKRSLDDLVIQKGEFDWRSLFNDESALTKALGDFEDAEDRHAAAVATREEISLVGADEDDFGERETLENGHALSGSATPADVTIMLDEDLAAAEAGGIDDEDQEEAGGTVVDYMLTFVEDDYDFFRDWRL
jgi:helicase SWR1